MQVENSPIRTMSHRQGAERARLDNYWVFSPTPQSGITTTAPQALEMAACHDIFQMISILYMGARGSRPELLQPKRLCHATHRERSTSPWRNADFPPQIPNDQNARTPNIRPTSVQQNMTPRLQGPHNNSYTEHCPQCFTYSGSCPVQYNPKERMRSPGVGVPPQAVLWPAARAVAESEAWSRRLVSHVSDWTLVAMRCGIGEINAHQCLQQQQRKRFSPTEAVPLIWKPW